MIVDKTPEQLKMPFALWTRKAVQELIDRTHGVKMPIRSVGHNTVKAQLRNHPAPQSQDQLQGRLHSRNSRERFVG